MGTRCKFKTKVVLSLVTRPFEIMVVAVVIVTISNNNNNNPYIKWSR